jgi:hypothetical protein
LTYSKSPKPKASKPRGNPDLVREGSRLHNRTVKDLIRIQDDYAQALEGRFRGIVDNWKRYYNNRDDHRLPGEDWRAFTRRPTAFQIVETLVATNTDLVCSADPMVQVDGVGMEDDPMARAIEREIDMDLRRNKFNIHFEHMQRAKRVQGITFGKVTWRKSHVMTTAPRNTPEAKEAFQNAVREAERQTRTKAPIGSDPLTVDLFEQWRQVVNRSMEGRAYVPSIPTDEVEQRTVVEGPWIERPSVFFITYDPTIETIPELPYLFHKIPTKYDDLLKRADNDKDSQLPYLLDQCQKAKDATSSDDFTKWNKEVASATGLSDSNIYPDDGSMCEVMEVWTNDPEMPFVQILNRKCIINKTPWRHPYVHGMKPFFRMVNTPIENQMIGMSEFEPVIDLYERKNKMADLLDDAVTMAVLPILLRTTGSGFNPTTAGSLRPGTVLDVRRPDGLKLLDKMNPGILDAFRELGSFQDEIDNTHATWGNVRGAGASVGRVSATDSVNRMNQALVRQKIHAMRDETDMQDMVVMMLALRYQFGKDEVRRNVGGQSVSFPRERFLDAMYEDFKLRGATKAMNKAERVQALTQFDQQFKESMLIGERRALMKEVLYTEGIKSVDRIVTDAGTMRMKQDEMLARQPQMPPPMPGGGLPGGPPQPPPEGGGAPPGVNPAPTDLGQEMPLAVLEQLAQGVPFESQAPPA